jgi:hypothetical protein
MAIAVLFSDANCIPCVGQVVCFCVLLSKGAWCANAQEVEALLVVGETVTGAQAVVQVVKFWDYHVTGFA